MGASSLREAQDLRPQASPPLCAPGAAQTTAPQRPRLVPRPRVCLTLNPAAAAAGGEIPGGVNPAAGPQLGRRARPSPLPSLVPRAPTGWRVGRRNEPGGCQSGQKGPLARAPLFPGSWKADSRSEHGAQPSVFSAAFPRVLYLDRLYLQYTCLRLVIPEAGMETGQSRNSPLSPQASHLGPRLGAVEGSPSAGWVSEEYAMDSRVPRTGGTLPSIERVIPPARHSRKA